MNWVGGSRNRFMLRNDLRKQREYFEKKKMQNKMKTPLPTSPKGSGSGSVDLVTLFIVNQIAAKKKNSELPQITHLNNNKGHVGLIKDDPLELPMSPCSPSHLSLVESQPQYSFQGIRKRKHCFPEGFKCQQLSPVFESNLSDNSASDYQLVHIADTLSPSSSSASSSGMFPLQLRGQTQPQLSPHPWETTTTKAQFRPYSQPSGMRESSHWSTGPNGSQWNQTPSLSRLLFRGTDSDTGTRDEEVRTLSLKQRESEEVPKEEDLFRGFCGEFRSDAPFRKGIPKISLKSDSQKASSTPADVNQPHSIHPVLDSLTQLSDCADVTTCLQQNHASVDCGGSSPSYSPRGYFSSESDDEDDCHQCVQEQPPLLSAPCFPDGPLGPSQASPWSPPPGPCQHSPGTRSSADLGAGSCPGLSQRLCNCASSSCSQPDRSGPDQAGSLITARHQSVFPQTRDMGTQTVLTEICHTTEAATQCSFGQERSTNNFPLCQCYHLGNDSTQFCVAAGSAVPTQALRGQESHRDEGLRRGARPDSISGRLEEEKHTPWRRATTGEDETGLILSRVSPERPATPILGDESSGNETESDKQLDQEVDRVRREVPDPVEREAALSTNQAQQQQELSSHSVVTRLSEEDQTLHQVSGNLLVLKDREKIEG